MHPINPTPQHFHVKPGSRCTNCGDVLPPGSPSGRMYCSQCVFPVVRKLRRRAPRQVRK